MPNLPCITGIHAQPRPLQLRLNVCKWPHPCSSALTVCVCVCLGTQSALEPDLQAKGAGAGENIQPAESGHGLAGPAGGLQTQRSPEGSVPQSTTLRPQ